MKRKGEFLVKILLIFCILFTSVIGSTVNVEATEQKYEVERVEIAQVKGISMEIENPNMKIQDVEKKVIKVITNTKNKRNSYKILNSTDNEIVPGKKITPIWVNEIILMPAKPVIEELGGTVEWVPAEEKLTISLKDSTIVMWTGKDEALVNGNTRTLDIPAQVIDGYTMVPAAFVARNLNCSFRWSADRRSISIFESTPGEDLERELEVIIKNLENLVEEIKELDINENTEVEKKYKEIIKISDAVLNLDVSNMYLDEYGLYVDWIFKYFKGRALNELGEVEESIILLEQSYDKFQLIADYDKKVHQEKIAGINFYIARYYMMQGNTKEALEKLAETKNSHGGRSYIRQITTDPVFNPIKNTEKYYDLVGIKVVIDGNPFTIKAKIKDGVVFGWYQDIFESLGAKTKWDEGTGTLTISKLNIEIVLKVGSKIAKVNGEEFALEAAPIKRADDPYGFSINIDVPIEFVAKALGEKVSWGEIELSDGGVYPAIYINENKDNLKYTEEQKNWAVATSANINLYNYGRYNFIGGNSRFRGHVLSVRDSLERGWNIYNREDYFQALSWLAQEGDDLEYRIIESQLSGMNLEALKKIITTKAPEELFLIEFYEKHKDELKDKGLIAWDYSRISQITGWAYMAGYLTIEEAYDISMGAARVIQETYSSWEEFAEHYMLGYEFWSHQDRNDETTQAHKRDKLNQRILESEESPWSILPWNLNLGE